MLRNDFRLINSSIFIHEHHSIKTFHQLVQMSVTVNIYIESWKVNNNGFSFEHITEQQSFCNAENWKVSKYRVFSPFERDL